MSYKITCSCCSVTTQVDDYSLLALSFEEYPDSDNKEISLFRHRLDNLQVLAAIQALLMFILKDDRCEGEVRSTLESMEELMNELIEMTDYWEGVSGTVVGQINDILDKEDT